MERAKQLAREVARFGEEKEVYRALKKSCYKEAIEEALRGEYTEEELEVTRKSWNDPKL